MVSEHTSTTGRSTAAAPVRVIVGLLFMLLAGAREAHASLLSPEAEDKLATFLAIFILFIVPVVLIVLFWLVHILPEKIAHKRQHPQFDAIRTLCLLSLVFGGLLWPLAWIWAYTKPTLYKMAYGTDKAPDHEAHGPADAAPHELGLQDRVARLERLGLPKAELKAIEADITALEEKLASQGAR
jgi:heme/copper-type cytochrome/quinol oxidase subunit 2